MIYRIPKVSEINEILVMKNNVKKRIIKQNLPMWLYGYPLDEYMWLMLIIVMHLKNMIMGHLKWIIFKHLVE